TDATTPPIGIFPTRDAEPQVQLSYRVDDIAAAVERVRAAGGEADEADEAKLAPYGLVSGCIDDQGTRFNLWQPTGLPAGPPRRRRAPAGAGALRRRAGLARRYTSAGSWTGSSPGCECSGIGSRLPWCSVVCRLARYSSV
ncbi:MAG: hypothetical protein ACRDNS_11005, partial [Trebonia sp.]